MPIRPELRHLYAGPGWRAIRARILARDGHACKWCGVPNYKHVVRYDDKPGYAFGFDDGRVFAPGGPTGDWVRGSEMPEPDRIVKIILTIAHLDRDPRNNADDNLAALCQWCHLHHDQSQHAANARRTRVARKDAARPLLVAMEAMPQCR